MLAATAPLFANAEVPCPEDSAPYVRDSDRRTAVVHVARLRVGPFLSGDGVLGGGFSQRPASPRPLSHGAREVTHRRYPLRLRFLGR